MHVILTKLSTNHNNLRTKVIVGIASELPEIGSTFRMTAKPLNPDTDIRLIETSLVTNIENEDNTYVFNTENSQYLLKVLSTPC